jgi:hypothetical protein
MQKFVRMKLDDEKEPCLNAKAATKLFACPCFAPPQLTGFVSNHK